MSATTASSKGAILGMGEWGDDDLIRDVERATPAAALIVNDWFWGGGAPDPTLIPWTWLSVPLTIRQDQPINSAQITGVGNATAVANDTASQAIYTVFSASATLATVLVADALNLARHLVTYYASPLTRCPTWTFDLTQRVADEEKWRILGRELGDRATLAPSTITDLVTGASITLPVPAALPAAARSIVIEGIEHSSAPTGRVTAWTTSPLLGPTPGVEGPWFRLGTSRLDGTDPIPF